MPPLLKNTLALLAGIAAGSVVNMVLITASPSFIPPPMGVDVNDAGSLTRGMHLFEPRHFVMPFLAHAVGTFVGALVAYLVAATRKASFAYAIGAIFLCGGVAAGVMLPAPAWFIVVDLLVAYLPMAWLAVRLAARLKGGRPSMHNAA